MEDHRPLASRCWSRHGLPGGYLISLLLYVVWWQWHGDRHGLNIISTAPDYTSSSSRQDFYTSLFRNQLPLKLLEACCSLKLIWSQAVPQAPSDVRTFLQVVKRMDISLRFLQMSTFPRKASQILDLGWPFPEDEVRGCRREGSGGYRRGRTERRKCCASIAELRWQAAAAPRYFQFGLRQFQL